MVVLRFSRRKKLTIAAILLVAVLLEVYAHNYVQVHALSVIPEDQAVGWSGPYVGSYGFVQSDCNWLAKWTIERPTSHSSYAWIRIFKIGENSSFLSPRTGILVSSLIEKSNVRNFERFF